MVSFTADTAIYLRVHIPGLIVNTSDYRQYRLRDTSTVPDHPVLRGIFAQLRSDYRIEAVAVTNYGLEVHHDHAKPSDIIRLIEPVI